MEKHSNSNNSSQNETPIPIIDRESTSKNIINYI
jgi:hypothetical protein